MDDHSGGETPSSSDFLDWERDLIKKVAARYPEVDQQELKAELEATAWEEKFRNRPGVRDPKAYLYRALMNRATTLIRKQREVQTRVTSLDLHPGLADLLAHSDDAGLNGLESRQELSEIRRKLDTESYALLELWARSGGNVSLVARLSGKHRNTIRRSLQKIWPKISCPIRNVSGCIKLTPKDRQALLLTAHAPGVGGRQTFKARLILALASEKSYREIMRRFHTTAPTIARWKKRFLKSGIAGLAPIRYERKSPAASLVNPWLVSAGHASQRLSYRHIARALGISKSTVQRVLKDQRHDRSS